MQEYILYGLLGIIIIQLIVLQRNVALKRIKQKSSNVPVLIDTSVLMDGRIITIAKLGFMPSDLLIPRSVLLELQLLADKSDSEKRMRARAGLDAVKQLQQIEALHVVIIDETNTDGVDNHLLALAKTYPAMLCTIDYNLNKVAQAENITVINPNELAKSIRMSYLPGEKLSLELVQKGQEQDQAVGYLADGTMVVVERSGRNVGKTIEIEFIRALQTAAGKMMFAKPVSTQAKSASTKRYTLTKSSKDSTKTKPRRNGEDRLVALANEDSRR